MADVTIPDLTPELASVAAGDLFIVEDISAGTTNKVQAQNMASSFLSSDAGNLLASGTDGFNLLNYLGLVSTDAGNLITEGADNKLSLVASNLISSDASNTAQVGADDKLFVPPAVLPVVDNLTVLGNTSGAPLAADEVDIIDDDTMGTASDTTLATSESIKTYVDTTAGGAMKRHCRGSWDGTGATGSKVVTGQAGTTTITVNKTSTGRCTVTMADAHPNGTEYSVVFNGWRDVSTHNIGAAAQVLVVSSTEFQIATEGGAGLSDFEYISVEVTA